MFAWAFQAVLVDTESFDYETIKIPKKLELDVVQLPDFN
jgi:hypothetical protein